MTLISHFFELSSKSCTLFLKIIFGYCNSRKKDYNSKTLSKYWNQKINMNIILIFLAYIFLIAVCYGIYYRKNAILISYSKAFEYFFFFHNKPWSISQCLLNLYTRKFEVDVISSCWLLFSQMSVPCHFFCHNSV